MLAQWSNLSPLSTLKSLSQELTCQRNASPVCCWGPRLSRVTAVTVMCLKVAFYAELTSAWCAAACRGPARLCSKSSWTGKKNKVQRGRLWQLPSSWRRTTSWLCRKSDKQCTKVGSTQSYTAHVSWQQDPVHFVFIAVLFWFIAACQLHPMYFVSTSTQSNA